jgi:hypothetical protein
MKIPERGGPLTQTTVINGASERTAHRFPSFLPDGRHFIYSVTPNHDYINDIEVGSIDGEPGRKIESLGGAVYAEPGYLSSFMTVRSGRAIRRRFAAVFGSGLDHRLS